LVAEAGTREEGGDLSPGARPLADLLLELALGGVERRLPLDIKFSRRDLERSALADRLPRLTGEPHVLAVHGQDADGSRVPHLLARDLLAVGMAKALNAHRDDLALPFDL